ncbi:MAG: XrtA/PEP-CTERM system TPR-repeat protein PrsT [Rubrivivax sp.]
MSVRTSRHALLGLLTAAALVACGGESAPELLKSGKDYLAQKEPNKAVIQFKAALQKDADSAEGRYLLGKALLDTGDPAGAVLELNKALDQQYDRNLVMPALAKALLLSGGAKKLTALYADVTLQDPKANAGLKATLANAWGVLGNLEMAQAALAQAAASDATHPAVQVIQARLLAASGKLDEALALIDKVLKADDAYFEAWHLKGDVLGAKGLVAESEAAWRKALASEPAFMASHLALISSRLRAKDLAGAKAQSDALRQVLPRHPQTLFLDARMAILDKDYKKARELTQQLLRISPENVGVLQLAGAVESASGSLVVAESYLSKALSLDPGLPAARLNMGRAYLRMGQPLKALRVLEPLLGAKSSLPDALGVAGEAYLQLGDPQSAEQLFIRAAKVAPEDTKARTALALLRLSRGDSEAAFSQLAAIAEASQDTAAEMATVSARLKRKEFDAALAALEKMSKKQPNSATVPELRGMVLSAKKDYAGARKAYEEALSREPGRFNTVASLASLDLMENKFENAEKRVREAIASDPRNHSARMALANIQLQQKKPLEAVVETLKEGITAAPTEAAPRLQLVELLLTKKQYKEALLIAQEALASLPGDNEVLDMVGRAQALTGDTQQAISTFRRLASSETKSARPHLRLADVQASAGDRDGAIASLRRALEVEPQNESVQAKLMELLVAGGKPKEALEMAKAMQLRSPDNATGYLLEGAVHRRLKALPAAQDAYSRGLQAARLKNALAVEFHRGLMQANREAEADKFATKWLADNPADPQFSYHYSSVLLAQQQYAKAETVLSRLLGARPDDVLVLNNLAWVLAKQNKPGAVVHAQRAVELLPNRASLLDTLAFALAADRQYPKALETQRKAIEIAPGEMGYRLGLARIAVAAGDKATAKTELERLATLGTKFPAQAEVAKLQKSL